MIILKTILEKEMQTKLQIDNFETNKKRRYTTVDIKDELTLQLSSPAQYHINQEYGRTEINYKYYEFARKILFSTPIAKEIPVFEISRSDLSEELQRELEKLDEKTLDEVVFESICRLYDSVNFRYFHESGIRGKIKWRIL